MHQRQSVPWCLVLFVKQVELLRPCMTEQRTEDEAPKDDDQNRIEERRSKDFNHMSILTRASIRDGTRYKLDSKEPSFRCELAPQLPGGAADPS